MRPKLRQRLYSLTLLFAVIMSPFAATLPVRVGKGQSGGFADVAGSNYHRINVVLHVDHAPEPGGIANFTLSATPLANAPDLVLTWQLPDGGELLGGPASETAGAVTSGATVEQTRQVRFPKAGVYTVQAQATYHPDHATTYTALGVLFFTIDASGSSVSDVDPRLELYEPPGNKPIVDKSGMAAAASTWGPDVPQGCFSVTGILTREERQPVANPPAYNNLLGSAVPVHHILVEMREEDTFSDDSYGHTVTDSNGIFQFNFCDGDGVLNSELELYYRVCSEVWDGPQIARIMNASAELYCWDSGIIESEGGNVHFGTAIYTIPQIQSQVFNIADGLYWASRYWNINTFQGAPTMDRSVNVRWEAGRRVTGSFYNQPSNTIVLADDASSFDQWDDSVIIHEWGHFADAQFSCNNSPNGPHTLPGWNPGPGGDRLSWGEGYPDYYQGAARTIMPNAAFTNWYIDVNGPSVDLEVLAGTAGALNEAAVASLLWDFMDTTVDISDTVSHGHAQIQRVYTDPTFRGNPQCNMASFLTAWKNVGYATNTATSSTVVQNVNITNPFAASAAAKAAASATSAGTDTPVSIANLQAIAAAKPYDYRWWDQVTMVVDNSTSMAGQKLDAVKALIREQANKFVRNPHGTQFDIYTFNASSTGVTPLKLGRFFVGQELYDLPANGADTGCPVNALYALVKAAEDKFDAQAWVYTDGESQPYVTAQWVQQQLNERLIRGSVVMLAGCNSTTPTAQPNITGAEKTFLGVAADGSQPSSIVPYLLTAIGTGGQFLYVAPDQLANAADILIAQADHSAGAGRWSDYVSDSFTYRYDRLQSWESNYYPVLDSLLDSRGALSKDAPKRLTMPASFNFYGTDTTVVDVYQDGYVNLNPCTVAPQFCLLGIDKYAYILEGEPDLQWAFVSNPNLASVETSAESSVPSAPDQNGPQVWVWSGDAGGGWYIIATEGEGVYEGGSQTAWRAYQIWLNMTTGEIRYLYDRVRTSDSASAKIGLANSVILASPEFIVSNRTVSGAANGMGYKFTPAPPQPTKSYTVAVDSLVDSVGFLQTGYSGSFAPMLVYYPDGSLVDCADTENVLCLSLNSGLLQYVQVDTGDRTGTYTAVIDAGSTGEGTFSFNAIAASPVQPRALGKRTLALEQQNFLVDLGSRADNNMLSGWLQTATGARFGSAFSLYDDGAHGDDKAGDGIFGSDGFTPPNQAVAYLWVHGAMDGVNFARSDQSPYNFQPLKVEAEPAFVQGFLGSQLTVRYAVTNQDVYNHCYYWEVSVPEGWEFVTSSGSPFCVAAGATAYPEAYFNSLTTDQPGGVNGEFNATFTEQEEGRIVGGASVKATHFRDLDDVEFDNRWIASNLRPDTSATASNTGAANAADTVSMTVNLLDDQGSISGWSGSLGYELSTTLGAVNSPTGAFENGRMPVVFTAGNQTGQALITINVEGTVATTTLQIRTPFAAEIDLDASPTDLSGEVNESTLVATLRDEWGDPVVGQSVRLSVASDDGVQGAIAGSEVFTATTNSSGQVSATFTEGEAAVDFVAIRAEALLPEGNGFRTTHEDVAILTFSAAPEPDGATIMLPLLGK